MQVSQIDDHQAFSLDSSQRLSLMWSPLSSLDVRAESEEDVDCVHYLYLWVA